MLKYRRLWFLIFASCCLLAAAESGLQTPNPISPKGPSPLYPEFKWSAVPGAEFYVLRVWTEANRGCPGRDEPTANGEKSNPLTYFYSPEVCDANTCGVAYNPKLPGVKSPVTGRPVQTQPQPLNAAREAAQKEGGGNSSSFIQGHAPPAILTFARACGPDGKTHDGRLYVWRWSVQAVAALNAKTSEWGKESPQSQQMSYSRAESLPPRPAPAPAPEPKPHPITFVNRSGMNLYIYYSFGGGGTVPCENFRNGGMMADGQSSQQFIIPAKSSAQFVFQKSADPCTFDQQFTTRSSNGGNPVAETVVIPR